MSSSSPLPLTVGGLIEAQAHGSGNHPFLICDDRTITYGDAARHSAALAGGLLASGLAHGSRVGLLYPNGPEFAVAALAAARIGAVAVPVSTFSTAVEVRTVLNNADVDMLLAAPGYRTHDYVRVLSEAVPELDLGARPPLFSPSVPALRRVAFDSPGGTVDAGWTVGSMVAAGRGMSPDILRASQERVSPSDRLVIVHTSGSSMGCGGTTKTRSSFPTRPSSGSADTPIHCWERSRPEPRWCVRTRRSHRRYST